MFARRSDTGKDARCCELEGSEVVHWTLAGMNILPK